MDAQFHPMFGYYQPAQGFVSSTLSLEASFPRSTFGLSWWTGASLHTHPLPLFGEAQQLPPSYVLLDYTLFSDGMIWVNGTFFITFIL